MQETPYDVVVFGATSFMGKLVVEHLAEYQTASSEHFRWAIADYSRDKLGAISDKTMRQRLADPFMLCPPDHGFKAKQRRIMTPTKDKPFGT